jgi:hypothetical protein
MVFAHYPCGVRSFILVTHANGAGVRGKKCLLPFVQACQQDPNELAISSQTA